MATWRSAVTGTTVAVPEHVRQSLAMDCVFRVTRDSANVTRDSANVTHDMVSATHHTASPPPQRLCHTASPTTTAVSPVSPALSLASPATAHRPCLSPPLSRNNTAVDNPAFHWLQPSLQAHLSPCRVSHSLAGFTPAWLLARNEM